MKLPRDVSGEALARLLKKVGYEITRQKGPSEHHLTIPNHYPIKIGTLSSILAEVAMHQRISKDQLIELLFG